jgi:hypothetical protein
VDIPEDGTKFSPGDTVEFTFHNVAPELLKEPVQCRIKDCDGRFKDVDGGWLDSGTDHVTIPITFTDDMIGYSDDEKTYGSVYLECYIGDMLVTTGSVDFINE